MKKWIVFIFAAALLCGCGVQPTFETVDDQDLLVVSAPVREVKLNLPAEAAKPAMQTDDGDSLYLCNGYTLTVQTLDGGDLGRTLRQVTGYWQEELQPLRTKFSGATRYDLTWSAAGEGGDQVARAVILDDGQYHYAVCVMAEADMAGQLQNTWQDLLGSVTLRTD